MFIVFRSVCAIRFYKGPLGGNVSGDRKAGGGGGGGGARPAYSRQRQTSLFWGPEPDRDGGGGPRHSPGGRETSDV